MDTIETENDAKNGDNGGVTLNLPSPQSFLVCCPKTVSQALKAMLFHLHLCYLSANLPMNSTPPQLSILMTTAMNRKWMVHCVCHASYVNRDIPSPS